MELIKDFLNTYFAPILIVGQFILGYMGLMFGKRFATKKELNEVEIKVDKNAKEIVEVDNRVNILKNDIKHLPTAEDITNLRNDICQLGKDISGLEASNEATKKSVDLFNEYLINQSKGK